jgi:hypothetical protein
VKRSVEVGWRGNAQPAESTAATLSFALAGSQHQHQRQHPDEKAGGRHGGQCTPSVIHSFSMSAEPVALGVVRRGLLGLLTLGTIGMLVELWLVEHFDDANQVIPVTIGTIGLVSIVGVLARPNAFTVRALQFVMLCYAGAGIIGISMHYQSNVIAQHGANPALTGAPLFWQVVRSPAPPALSPGILVQLALLGLLSTYRHPVLSGETWPAPPESS